MLSLSKSFCSPWGFIAKWKCSLCLWHDFRFVNFVNQRNIEFIFQNTWNLLVDFGVHRAIALTQHSFAFKLPDDPCTHFLVYSLFCQRALSWKTQCEHGFQTVLRVIIHFCYKSSWWDGLWTFCSFALSLYRWRWGYLDYQQGWVNGIYTQRRRSAGRKWEQGLARRFCL